MRENETFATAVGCMDGRGQEPVSEYARARWHVSYIDTITDAGIVNHIAHTHNVEYLANIKTKIIDVSVLKHGSRGVVVWGHQECAGHPVPDEHHIEDIKKAAKRIHEMEPGVEVVPVFVIRQDSSWEVQEI